MRSFAIALGLASALGAAAPASPAAAAPKVHRIVMASMGFGPAPAGIKAGDTVVWVNKDIFRHTATARDKSFDVDIAPGKEGRTVVKRPGQFAYFCRFHPGMTGKLLVAP
jgi:plastocyanin